MYDTEKEDRDWTGDIISGSLHHMQSLAGCNVGTFLGPNNPKALGQLEK